MSYNNIKIILNTAPSLFNGNLIDYSISGVNPKFSAWIKYYITDVIEQNPNYFKDHMNAWYNERSKNVGVICAYKK